MTTLAQVSETQAQKATTVNENFTAVSPAGLFGRRAAGIFGITWAWFGGRLPLSGTAVSNGSAVLTASTTNYVEADPSTGVVTVALGSFTAGKIPLYTVTTAVSSISSYDDYRTALTWEGATLSGNNTWSGNTVFDGNVTIGTAASPTSVLVVDTAEFSLDASGNMSVGGDVAVDGRMVVGAGALADAATDGFLYIPATTSGPPTGTPVDFAGRVPMVYEEGAETLWIFNNTDSPGSWRSVVLA